MATIVYLDVEDEITFAAARIRSAEESRVALVLPFSSRLATSRINFRLLAREAMVNGHRLDIVAPDASARALAASAGLPVFASVAEYEVALERPPADADAATVAGAQTATAAGAAAIAAGTAARSAGAGDRAGVAPTESLGPSAATGVSVGPVEPAGPASGVAASRAGEPMVVGARRRRPGTGLVAGVAILLLALLVAGVAGVVFLPAAEITVTPLIEPIGPISFSVRADPAATAVDPETGVIPAQRVEIPVESSGDFPATGKRVESTSAQGGVRWTNCDPTASYTIPRGTQVKTSSGIAFTVDEQVLLPVASLTGTPPNVRVQCQTSEVGVTAVKPGPDGNVGAGEIKVVPPRYNRTVVRVTNPAATSGGKRDEFPKVTQKDVDAAMAQLGKDVTAQFATALQDPANVPEGATIFPGTAALGEPVADPVPSTLVNQEVESFTLTLSATGSVLAVDSTPVEAVAESRLESSVSPAYQIVDGSVDVTVGEGTVSGGKVVFPVHGSAKQVRPLDAEALERQVLGLDANEARRLLSAYGDVQLTLWPSWVTSVPGFAQRVTFTVASPVDVGPGASPGPGASASPDASGAGGGQGGEPVPSG